VGPAARRAGVAGIAILEIRAVDRLREDARQAGLAGSTRADEEDRMRDSVPAHGVAKCLDDGFLPHDLGEGLRAPTAVEGLVRDG
jgi:hypothetical protein